MKIDEVISDLICRGCNQDLRIDGILEEEQEAKIKTILWNWVEDKNEEKYFAIDDEFYKDTEEGNDYTESIYKCRNCDEELSPNQIELFREKCM